MSDYSVSMQINDKTLLEEIETKQSATTLNTNEGRRWKSRRHTETTAPSKKNSRATFEAPSTSFINNLLQPQVR